MNRFVVAATLLFAGAAHADETYEMRTEPAKVAIGAKSKTSVTIAAKPGWHVNEEAPISVKLTPGPGIAVDKPKLTRADLATKSVDNARFDIGFVASEAGSKTIAAEASFVMCQATTCKPIKEKLSLAVEVAAAEPPAKKKSKR